MIYSEIIMVKTTSGIWRICSLLVALVCAVPVSLYAQERDFTTWASAGFKYKEEFYKLKYCSTVVYMVPRA